MGHFTVVVAVVAGVVAGVVAPPAGRETLTEKVSSRRRPLPLEWPQPATGSSS